ncbi:hypothetical protein Tco_1224371 [Tanacetum coccineum]
MVHSRDRSTIRDIEFEGMTVIGLTKLLKGACMFPVKEDDDVFDVGEMEDLNTLRCYDISDKSDASKCSQPSGKELDIDCDDEDVDKQFKLVDGVRVEVVVKKGDWPAKKGKSESVQTNSTSYKIKGKGVQINSPAKKGQNKGVHIKSPANKGGLIEHYSRLWDYRKQLLDNNRGSSIHFHVDEHDNGKV